MAEAGLPPVVARMWGRDTGSRHGPRPSQDLGSIVDAAIRIADRDGLDGVTMSSVAGAVGMATMSLYRYVGSKDELLILMADAAVPEPPPLDGRDWRAYLTDWTRTTRDFLLSRPWLLALGQTTPPAGPRTLRWLDRALGALAGTGLDYGQRLNVATTLTSYASRLAAMAHALNQPDGTASTAGTAGTDGSAGSDGGDPVGGPAGYGAMLAQLLDPDVYPALAAAVRENAFGGSAEWVEDADFTFGLGLLLDGIDALVSRERSPATG
ncbi:TetR/AcrR family transcriptional regulator [Cryptosporangium minutisporangium]|uniref:TetR/AcrR family transcriptional regulator n=1 Tax=Cryptosporangium minutisporangium TaxID=113569 RepID=A0ABP6T6C0_9ACTN